MMDLSNEEIIYKINGIDESIKEFERLSVKYKKQFLDDGIDINEIIEALEVGKDNLRNLLN